MSSGMFHGGLNEILSIAAWATAAATTLYFYSRLLPLAKQYFNNDMVAAGATIGGLVLGTLIIVSILTVRLSDKILDSRIGALDRTLGFIFGLARGFLLVAIVFILFTALARDQPDWVRNARSYPILQQTQVAIESLLPMNPEQYLPSHEDQGTGTQPETQPEGQQPEAPPSEGAPAAPDQKS